MMHWTGIGFLDVIYELVRGRTLRSAPSESSQSEGCSVRRSLPMFARRLAFNRYCNMEITLCERTGLVGGTRGCRPLLALTERWHRVDFFNVSRYSR